MTDFVWDADALFRLKELADEGKSFADIATIFTKEHGRMVSCNQIIGICHRQGIKTNYTAPPRPSSPRRKSNIVTIRVTVPATEPTPVGPKGDLPGAACCRYIKGEPDANFVMCGHPTGSVTRPWCPYHSSLVGGVQSKPLTRMGFV